MPPGPSVEVFSLGRLSLSRKAALPAPTPAFCQVAYRVPLVLKPSRGEAGQGGLSQNGEFLLVPCDAGHLHSLLRSQLVFSSCPSAEEEGAVPTWRPGAAGTSRPSPTPAVCAIGDINVRASRVLEGEAAPRWWGPARGDGGPAARQHRSPEPLSPQVLL